MARNQLGDVDIDRNRFYRITVPRGVIIECNELGCASSDGDLRNR